MNIGFPQSPISGVASIDAYYTDGHATFIREFSEKRKPRIIVEVGSGIGRITECLVHCADLVYALDQWTQNTDPQVDERSQQRHPHSFDAFCVTCWDQRVKIIPIHGKSTIGLAYLSEKGVKPDAIYLDGLHTKHGLVQDIETCQTLFPDAVLFGDDLHWNNGITEPIYLALIHAQRNGYECETHKGEFWELIPKKEVVPA